MELKLQNQLQHSIADLLWAAQSQEDVSRILRVFGHDARVVYELMIAETFDDIDNTDLASQVLDKFRA